jgi:hypothetical protein
MLAEHGFSLSLNRVCRKERVHWTEKGKPCVFLFRMTHLSQLKVQLRRFLVYRASSNQRKGTISCSEGEKQLHDVPNRFASLNVFQSFKIVLGCLRTNFLEEYWQL